MSFPYYIHLLNYRIHPHPFFEVLAYFISARLYFWMRRKQSEKPIPLDLSLWLLGGCLMGALTGSKILAWLEAPAAFWSSGGEFKGWENGKTIVGGLLGGWLGVELVKKALRVTTSTGDAFVFPTLIGTTIGRIGCFLTGLDDRTHGVACAMPWCVDFGDSTPRHPTQLYEIAFLLLYGICLLVRTRTPTPNGYLFRLYIFGYLLFRFIIEFIKPRQIVMLQLSAIQIASLAGAAWAVYSLSKLECKREQTN